MSLQLRLVLAISVLVATGIAAASAAGFISARSELLDETDEFLKVRAAEIVSGARAGPENRRGPGPDPGSDLEEAVRRPIEADSIVQAIDEQGVVIASSGGHIPVDDVDRELADKSDPSVIRDIEIGGETYRVITQHVPGGGAVQVARALDETEAVLADLLGRMVLIGLALSAAAAVTGWLIARRTTKPLRALTVTAEQVAATQDLSVEIDVSRGDEVGRLASSFDAMLGALATSRAQQHRLVIDAGHELRTPLTSLRANVDQLSRSSELGAEQAELVDAVRSELGELTLLFTELIELATDAHDQGEFEAVDLVDVVNDALNRLERRSGREIRLTIDGPSIVSGNRTLLERSVSNLLSNAHKFSPTDRPIEVTVAGGEVRVRDHGPGISADERPRVFDRFYRSERTRGMPGSGLGLAIVRQVVDQHAGTLLVRDAPGGGAEVGFRLPVTA